MQEDGLPLLRLGRELKRHEVSGAHPLLPAGPVLTRPCSSFIKSLLPRFAAAHPEIEVIVSPRPTKHPIVSAHYINGNTRAVCVKNLHANQIQQKVELLRDSTGERNKRYSKPVKSINESVRGIWSPYHGQGLTV
ncbi:hypothetical protein FJTKL_02964 [Diaporthe vaccinii]|uniref:Large ribosomal subunit protein mL43 n=1 Tax=Diaporthe vaccinii TaxID=105482 RepID=A0ABR4F3A0_9PEZI